MTRLMLAPLLAVAAIGPAAATAVDIGGAWEGSYTCNQGLTGLTLTIVPSPDDSIKAIFRFYQINGNPGVPDGCFAMSGVVDGNRLALTAGGWLDRPPGYVTVDLAGTVSSDGTALAGSIHGPNCTTFDVRRVAHDATPKACQLRGIPVS